MGTTKREEDDFDEIKMGVHQRAKKIISSFPGRIVYLTRICHVNSPSPEVNPSPTTGDASTGNKRRRDDSDEDSDSLARMKRVLATERESFLSDVDDLTLTLNLHLLKFAPDDRLTGVRVTHVQWKHNKVLSRQLDGRSHIPSCETPPCGDKRSRRNPSRTKTIKTRRRNQRYRQRSSFTIRRRPRDCGFNSHASFPPVHGRGG